MPLTLTYFKRTGKYYSQGQYEPQSDVFHKIVAEVDALVRKKELPGLMKGHSEFIVHFVAGDVPHIIVPDEMKL